MCPECTFLDSRFSLTIHQVLDRGQSFTIFRSSGRMFWPLGYLIVFGVLVTQGEPTRSGP